MPVENLTKEEDEIFLKMLEIMKKQRENFLTNQKKDTPLKNDVVQEKPRQHVYIAKKTLESFVGPDLNVYTIKENEIIALDKLPKPLNDLLLKEGVIEPIEK
jgi:DNA replication initiation complex subunit (GINS family)